MRVLKIQTVAADHRASVESSLEPSTYAPSGRSSQSPAFVRWFGTAAVPSQAEKSTGTVPSLGRERQRSETMERDEERVRGAVNRHLSLVWRVLRRVGLSPADADDGCQDVFWVFARRTADVPERSERAFLVSTALRVAADRRRSKWARSVTEPLDPETRVLSSSPEEHVEARRQLSQLDRALGQLEEDERTVFVLSAVEQMTKSEVALLLSIPEGTVASRLRRAKHNLAEILREFSPSEDPEDEPR